MATGNTFNIRNDIKSVNEGGRRVIAKAQGYIGEAESPALSDTGTNIDRWNNYFSASAIAWAGSFATAMYWESSVWDDGIGDPNPIIMYQRAVAKGRVSPIGFPGCFVLIGTFSVDKKTMLTARTVEIFVRWQNIDTKQAVTIGGNVPIGAPVTNHVVKQQFRNIIIPDSASLTQKAIFVVPKSVSVREATIKRIAA